MTRRRCLAAALLTATVLAVAAPAPADPSAAFTVSSDGDFLGLPNRLVFSTVNEEARPARRVIITAGPADVVVTAVTLTGGAFALEPGQATAFTVPAGTSAPIGVVYRPAGWGRHTGQLDITTDGGAVAAALSGWDAQDYEGSNEPRLQQIVRTLGYSVHVGSTRLPLSTSANPVGDEVLTPSFVAVDSSQPVDLVPVARYTSRGSVDTGLTGWASSDGEQHELYAFATCTDRALDPSCGENQRLVPEPTGTTSFVPDGPFTIFSNGASSDDEQNNGLHDWRFYPAVDAGGVPVAGTWIGAMDNDSASRNWDYQDLVVVLRNASPAEPPPPAPTPGPASGLDFDAPVPGTLADGLGNGTGFVTAQANDAGDQYRPAKVVLDAPAGALRITSTSGTSASAANSQHNALELPVDVTTGNFRVWARLRPPFTDVREGSQHKGAFFGPGEDEHFRVVLANRNGKPFVSASVETGGKSVALGSAVLPTPASVKSVDLFVRGSSAAHTLQAFFRFGSDDPAAVKPLGGAVTLPAAWFSDRAMAGVLTSHAGSAKTVVAVLDHFSIDPA